MAEEGADITIGNKDVDPKMPSHVPGVHEGNWPSSGRRRQRKHGVDPALSGNARRSTGIEPKRHGPIDVRMPRLTPP